MKRIIALTVAFLMVFSLASCGSKDKTDDGSVEVDEGIVNVEITIPADFFEDETEDEIKAGAEEKGFSKCVVNDDGSVTYTMSKAKRKEVLKEMEASFDETADEIIKGDEEVPSSFTEITHNKDFKVIEMKANENYGGFDGLYMYSMLMMGSYYQVFNGVSSDKLDVTVKVINKESGEELDSISVEDLRNMSDENGAEE